MAFRISGAATDLTVVVLVMVVAAATIAVAGARLTRVADRLADATWLGEAMFGAILLGGTTSLPGLVASLSAAAHGYPELALSNALGGIAAQTTFLAIADLAYRRANLEHAAASLENLLQGALLVTLLAVPLVASGTADVVLWRAHPASFLLVALYLYGLRLVRKARSDPLWQPTRTPDTKVDEPEDAPPGSRGALASAWTQFVGLGLIVAVAGYFVAEAGIALSDRTGLSQSLVGAYLTALATSLPELVTSVAAVRQGALTLAVGGIIGGNCFDVLFVAGSDVAYGRRAIYAEMTTRQGTTLGLSIFLTGALLMGMLRRERRGPGGVGFETVLVVMAYLAVSVAEVWQG